MDPEAMRRIIENNMIADYQRPQIMDKHNDMFHAMSLQAMAKPAKDKNRFTIDVEIVDDQGVIAVVTGHNNGKKLLAKTLTEMMEKVNAYIVAEKLEG